MQTSDIKRRLLLTVLTALLLGCAPDPTVEREIPPSGTIEGEVVSAQNNQGVAGATVMLILSTEPDDASNSAKLPQITSTTKTDSAGKFYFYEVLPTSRIAVRVEASGFAESLRSTEIAAWSISKMLFSLSPVTGSVQIDGNAGGTVTQAGSALQVVIPPNSLAPDGGASFLGTLIAQVSAPNLASDPKVLPGDFTTLSAGKVVPIESFGALSVSLVNAQGSKVDLAVGKSATIRIPVNTRSDVLSVPATVPLFYMDSTTGRWVQDGTATLSMDRTYYEGMIKKFSTWNAAQTMQAVTLAGCVLTTSGQPGGAGINVTADGLDYSSTAAALTNSQGCYSVPVKAGGKAAITAARSNLFSNPLTVGPSTEALNAQSSLVLGSSANAASIKMKEGGNFLNLNAYLIAPNGQQVYINSPGSLNASPFALHGLEFADGNKADIVTIRRLMIGTYSFLVQNSSSAQNPGAGPSPALVELSYGGQIRSFAPSTGDGNYAWWHVFDLNVDAQCTIAVVSRQLWVTGTPSRSAAATFCNAP